MPDPYDIAILQEVQKNAKITIKDLSEKINLSPTPTFERLKKLEKEGYITGYHAKLDIKKLGLSLMVMCNVSLKNHQKDIIEKFQEEIIRFDEVKECYHIAGMYDYLLKIIVKDMDAYQQFVSKKLASLDNIGNVQSSFVMIELKEDIGCLLEI
ncbi:MAG: Lrp/AsnC family transcriptional regulator [Saprospiraceae bacterium]|nr:Lrp/AsnC family transcriptional regulator [Saprospiraceae bacterium]MBP6566653.1 Lrp/AsnC family transcriptional regulator [Saprospiraceae bacterium]MBP9197589.1 Lrp/AsnC family transcriptional regulator [Saprospiraceae bacterium]